jgi:2-keto-4-pentenoate hydratase/2-oxohepta-3-ene-1,7-dioic acid hydratase in catechol pathway
MQDGTTADLIYDIPTLVSFISQSITLEPGDVIATGTPPGVGFARRPPVWLSDGDEVTIEIERIGRLTNPVRRPS